MKGVRPTEQGPPYLPLCSWDVEVWFASDSFHGLPTLAQGPYMNLCFRAWQRQPYLTLPDDDARLWKLAGCASLEEWLTIRGLVFGSGGWSLGQGGWTHPTVASSYAVAIERHTKAVRSGRIAGKASARVRREISKNKAHGTTVQRPSTQGRSTAVNPPSPSPSPSPSPETATENGTDLRLTPPTIPAMPVPGPWTREACDDWIARFGGTAPGGRIGRALKPLVDRHGWPVVRPAWARYLAEAEAAFASPSRFAETFGAWNGAAPQARASPARATVGEKSMAAAARFLARRSDGGRDEGDTGGAVPSGASPAQRKLPAGS